MIETGLLASVEVGGLSEVSVCFGTSKQPLERGLPLCSWAELPALLAALAHMGLCSCERSWSQQLWMRDNECKRARCMLTSCLSSFYQIRFSPMTPCTAAAIATLVVRAETSIHLAIQHCEGQLQVGSADVASWRVCTAAAIDIPCSIKALHICSHNLRVHW